METKKFEPKKVKIRLKGLERGPIEITILPRKKAIFDEYGIAEVDENIAKILLNPARSGAGYELIPEPKTEKEITPPRRISKNKEEAPPTAEVGEFVKTL